MNKEMTEKNYEHFMRLALCEAEKARTAEEVPVGAVVVLEGKVIARAFNTRISARDCTAHAEISALRKAGKKVGNWRLEGAELYVTLEPCAMCAGAAVNGRVKRIIFGAYDKKSGCTGSLYNIPEDVRLNHRPEVVGGVLEKECAEIISDFFKAKR